MELRHLRYFVAVAEALHFGRAASALRIAQPSLSLQIRQLEDELHATLLRRSKRRVELTESGQLFLEEAREILARAERAAMIAGRVGRADAGKLRVGVGYCMNQHAVVKAVSFFNRRYPKIRVELQTSSVRTQIDGLLNERLDVAFVRHPVNDSAITSELFVSEPLIAALPRRHRLARRPAVQLSALAGEPFVLTARDAVPVYREIVLKACRQAGFVPHAPHEVDYLQLLIHFVGAGCGVALVPAFARRMRHPGVVFASLQSPSTRLDTVAALRRHKMPQTLTDFIDVARRVLIREHRRASGDLRSRAPGRF